MGVFNGIQKYQNASVAFKATIWYTICNMLQKIAAFLILPFLTRMLTMADYGLYSVFLSWADIIEIFATMRIYSNGYVVGLVKHSEDQDRYTCSIQFVAVMATLICWAIFSAFSDQISQLAQIEKRLLHCMFLSFFATSSIGIWSSRQRVNNRYKLMAVVTLLYSVLAPISSIVGASLSPDRLEAVIMVRVFAQFIISAPFFWMNLLGAKKAVSFKYCKEAIAYNMPLIPFYLSMVVLNSSDRIMIKSIVGEGEAGIYSVAYSLSMAVSVFVGALNLSLQPWIFKQLKNNSANGAHKVNSLSLCFMALLDSCVLIASPELIRVVASEKYLEAVWAMPPIVCSLLVIFIYQQLLNIHFYFGENKIVFIASIAAASINLFSNYIFIPIFGYVAAGYTTLASYLAIAFLYFIAMKRISKKNGINYKDYFNVPLIFGVALAFGSFAVAIALLYPYPLVRYGFAAAMIAAAIKFRKHILEFVKRVGLIGKGS